MPVVEPVVLPRIERQQTARQRAEDARATARLVPDAREEAARIVAEARSTARAMLAQARDVIAGEREQAVTRGYAEGYADGSARADVEMAGLVATCERIALEAMNERMRVLGEQEEELVQLAISIASRIVNAAVDVDPDLVIDACRGAMRKAFHREQLHVLAHPDDLERLRAAGPQLARELGGIEHLDFVEERRIERGSVIVRTPAGEIDGTIAGKAARIEEVLREGMEQRRAARRAGGSAA